MPTSFSFGKIQFDLSPGTAAARARKRDPESPFLLAVLGDFTGRTHRGVKDTATSRRPMPVDCDNFEQTMRRLGAALRLTTPRQPETPIELRLESLDDFHPDQLLKKVAPLSALLDLRERLRQPATAAAAVQEAQGLLMVSSPPAASTEPAALSGESVQETMTRLLGGTPPSPPPSSKPVAAGFDINALIKGIVAPSVVPGATPQQSATLAAVELEVSAQLRAILHHPDFQAMEATWRGLDLLVREFGGEENIKLHLLDGSKDELAADLRAHDDLAQTAVFKSLRDQNWTVLVGAFSFEASRENVELLARMTKVSAALGAPFLAAAGPQFIGCDSLAAHPDPDEWTQPLNSEVREAWAALRALPEASHLGLTLPRVLMRQPYGKGSDPIDRLSFEELAGESAHESFLWGNSAFVCGYLLADAFRAEGWSMETGGYGELDGLPIYKFASDGETTVKPCAEAWLTERAGERILGHGLIPILSIKGRGAVRVAGLQSVALPPKPLELRTT
jgi:type VI secretion system protein ImpC